VAGLAVCAPFLVDAVRTLVDAGRHISMEGDTALLDLATRDFIRGNQLLGPYSRYGWHQPGPAVFAGLAGPVALFPRGAGLFLGTVLLDLAVLSTLMVFAWRRLQRTTVLWWAASVSAFVVVFGMGLLRRPWNPYMVVLPMALFVVLCADALTGRWASLAWALVAGSFAVQTHVSTGAVVVALLAVAITSLALRWWRRRRAGVAGAAHPSARRLTASGFGVFVLMWVLPMLDVVRHRPSNLQQLWDFFTSPHPAHSLGEAARASLTAATILPFGSHLTVEHPTRSAAALGAGAAAGAPSPSPSAPWAWARSQWGSCRPRASSTPSSATWSRGRPSSRSSSCSEWGWRCWAGPPAPDLLRRHGSAAPARPDRWRRCSRSSPRWWRWRRRSRCCGSIRRCAWPTRTSPT